MPAARPARDPRFAAERRGFLRHPVQMTGVLTVPTAAPVEVVVIDISEQGCQIVRPDWLRRDTAIRLSFGGFTPFDATVRWTAPGAAGLRFDQTLHPALITQVVSAARGRKRTRRMLSQGLIRREERERTWHLDVPAAFEDAAAPAADRAVLTGVLSDLSVDGCRIASAVAVLPGTALLIRLGEHQPMLAVVRWCQGGAIGCEFGEPLPPGVVEGLAVGAAITSPD